MNALEELFFGNIDPNANLINRDSRYSKTMQAIDASESKLMKMLGGEEKELFIGFSNAYAEINGVTAVNKFTLGFRLGALFMVDVFTCPDNGING